MFQVQRSSRFSNRPRVLLCCVLLAGAGLATTGAGIAHAEDCDTVRVPRGDVYCTSSVEVDLYDIGGDPGAHMIAEPFHNQNHRVTGILRSEETAAGCSTINSDGIWVFLQSGGSWGWIWGGFIDDPGDVPDCWHDRIMNSGGGGSAGGQWSAATWDRLAQCESGGNWAINTGNGYQGGLQFAAGTWRGFGGQEFASSASQASREEQITVAERVLAKQGPGAWPACTRKLGLR